MGDGGAVWMSDVCSACFELGAELSAACTALLLAVEAAHNPRPALPAPGDALENGWWAG